MKNKILLVLSILFGLIFLNAGLNKFFQYMPVPDDLPQNMIDLFGAMMQFIWLMPLIAIAEITGGILFMIPKFRPLGAMVIFPVMMGIILTHIINDSTGLPLALVLFAIELWVIYENREKYFYMIK